MNFLPVTPPDFEKLKKYFLHQPYQLSSYSLTTMVVWNPCILHSYYAVKDETVFVYEQHISDPGNKYFLLPVSPGKEFSPAELKELALKTGFCRFRFVPGTYVLKHGAENIEKLFKISEQKEYSDYIYPRENLAKLEGRNYAKKRNHVRRFSEEYVATGRMEIADISSANASHCLDFLKKWFERKKGKFANWAEELGCEKQAAINALSNFEIVGAQGIMLKIDGEVCGFGISSRLTDDMGVLNFEKAYDDIAGLYQFLDMECAKRIFPGCAYINKESDLGDPGLAKAKESYHPVMQIKSFQLELK